MASVQQDVIVLNGSLYHVPAVIELQQFMVSIPLCKSYHKFADTMLILQASTSQRPMLTVRVGHFAGVKIAGELHKISQLPPVI